MTSQNQVILEGEPMNAPVLSHENHGVRFYRFGLRVPRLSGQMDLLPIVTAESNLPTLAAVREMTAENPEYPYPSGTYPGQISHAPETYVGPTPYTSGQTPYASGIGPGQTAYTSGIGPGQTVHTPGIGPGQTVHTSGIGPGQTADSSGFVRVSGQFRSFNNRSGVGSRLILTVYAQKFEPGTGTPQNQIFLSGTLCKPPSLRRTPLGRSICDLMLAVPRRYGRADYLPVIAWGQLAVQTSELCVGDPLELEGRVQSRIYHKVTPDGIEERTAYEISMMQRL